MAFTYNRALVPALLMAGAAFPAAAQEKSDLPTRGADSITIGGGAAYVPSYEGSDDYSLVPIIQAQGSIKGFGFSTRGTTLYVDIIPDRRQDGLNFGFGPVATLRLDRGSLKGIKDVQVQALGKLDRAVEVGGWVGLSKTGVITSDYDTISIKASYAKDVAGSHGSSVFTPVLEYGTPLSRHNYIDLSISADRVGKGYGAYYYNVTPAGSVASGLPVYTAAGAKAGWKSMTVGLIGVQSLTGDLTHGLSLVVAGGYSRINGRYAASPIVSIAGDRDQWLSAIGLALSF